MRDVGRRPLLAGAQERAVARRIERGDLVAKERLIERNLRLVVSIAKSVAAVRAAAEAATATATRALVRAVRNMWLSPS